MLTLYSVVKWDGLHRERERERERVGIKRDNVCQKRNGWGSKVKVCVLGIVYHY
jgi:hypothetical protein